MNTNEVLRLALEALEYIRNIETDVVSQIKYGNASQIIEEALAKPDFWEGYVPEPVKPAQQEPMDFDSLFHEAEEIVRQKPTWKRFIDGTPLSNDIAVWMTVFAQDVARRISLPAQHHSKAWPPSHWTDYERSIAAAEREACAKVCDDWAKTSYLSEAKSCAKIIRARSNT